MPAPESPAVTTPLRTRREEQRARTRQELLDAAQVVFARQGYHATSVDDVAEAAGYTKGAVYSNFRSKEELFLELLDLRIDRNVEALEDVLLSSEAAERPRMLGEIRDSIVIVDREWFLLQTEFMLYAARNEEVRERVADRQRRTRERITELVRTTLADMGITEPRVPVEDLAQLLLSAASGLNHAGMIDDGVADASGDLLTSLAELLLDAISPPES
jgi:AcrR family transcriptional regulator